MITQAFVLGAGLGTRLRPLTDDLPKPLIPIFQKPLITFAFDHLIKAGCRKLIVNMHHRPEKYGGRPDIPYRDVSVHYRWEPDLLGTGGGIKNVEGLLGNQPFIVYSGDLLTDFALKPLIEEHFRSGNDVTLALRKTKLGAGIAWQDGRVVDIESKYGHPGEYDFQGVSVWNPQIFPRIPPGRNISFIPIVMDWIGQGGKIGGVVCNDGKWFNIGSRAEYLEVHRIVQAERWKPDYVSATEWPVQIAADAEVDPSARFSGFYSVGAGCRVGAGAILENTILWPGAQIASRSHLRNCIVRSNRKAEGEHIDTDI